MEKSKMIYTGSPHQTNFLLHLIDEDLDNLLKTKETSLLVIGSVIESTINKIRTIGNDFRYDNY